MASGSRFQPRFGLRGASWASQKSKPGFTKVGVLLVCYFIFSCINLHTCKQKKYIASLKQPCSLLNQHAPSLGPSIASIHLSWDMPLSPLFSKWLYLALDDCRGVDFNGNTFCDFFRKLVYLRGVLRAGWLCQKPWPDNFAALSLSSKCLGWMIFSKLVCLWRVFPKQVYWWQVFTHLKTWSDGRMTVLDAMAGWFARHVYVLLFIYFFLSRIHTLSTVGLSFVWGLCWFV